MPRGVYDRSKLKKVKSDTEPQVKEAPKAKRKYTRKAAEQTVATATATKSIQAFRIMEPGDIFFQLRELASLKAVGFSQVDSLIGKMLSKLEAEWDIQNGPPEKADIAEVAEAVKAKVEKKNGKTEEVQEKAQTALPAPVPFIPQPPPTTA